MNLVAYLLEQGHDLDPKDDFGQTPLFRAVEGDRIEVIDFLLKKKAEPNLLDSCGTTVQHISGFKGHQENSDYMMFRGSWKNRFAIEEPGPKKPPKHDWSFGTWPAQPPEEPASQAIAGATPAAANSSEVFITEKDSLQGA